ncbi:hypothetical protein [Tepidibacillus sp. HK-1]|uniref:pirin family protein n=1 Tax=Tepidibacillus sp. HK-1 TaxID=1883407 RepID=UPI0015EBFF69|nr:hypothetical protein [Tepidibacillus sp. HK-1]
MNKINLRESKIFLTVCECNSTINTVELSDRDGLEIVEEDILVKAKKTSHFLIIEMKKQD